MEQRPQFLMDYNISPEVILGNLTDGVYITDRDRQIMYWSDGAARITGWTAGEVVGKCCRDNILAHTDKDGRPLCGKEHCPLHRSIVTGQPTRSPIIVFARTRDGRRVPMNVYTTPLRDASGEIIGAIEVFRDLTHLMGELQRAKTIQRSALTLAVKEDPRLRIRTLYAPHDIVGGDFYAAEDLGEDDVAIMIADVMGHGIASALYGMFFRMLWSENTPTLGKPAEFLTLLDRKIHPLLSDNYYFATAAAFLLNKRTGRLTFAGAGHPPALIFRSNGEVEQLECSALPLGLLGQAVYEDRSTELHPGDSLLLYTDGSIEMEDRNGAEYGVEGLIAAFRHCLKQEGKFRLRAVEEHLLANSNSIRPADDVTMLWITLSGGDSAPDGSPTLAEEPQD